MSAKIRAEFLKVAKAVRVHPLLDVILVGVALRLFLSPLTAHPGDVMVWYVTASDMVSGGLGVYATKFFAYPPLWAYTFYPFAKAASFLVSPNMWGVQMNNLNYVPPTIGFTLTITSPYFNTIIKLPLIIADLLVGIVIYNIAKEMGGEKRAKLSFVLWFFNPLVIFVGSIHGMFDTLPALMALLAFYFLYKHNYLLSGIALSSGVLYKLYPVYFLPVYLFAIATLERTQTIKKMGFQYSKFLSGLLIPIFIFFVPVRDLFFHQVFTRVDIPSAIGGLTIWSVAYLPGMDGLFRFVIDNAPLSKALIVLCVGLSSVIGLTFFLYAKNFLRALVLGHIAVLVVIYMTSIVVNANYVIWILPFLILAFGLYNYYLIRLNLVWISALIFVIAWSGPTYFLFPLGLYTSISNIGTLIRDWTWWLSGNARTIFVHCSTLLGWPSLLCCLVPKFSNVKFSKVKLGRVCRVLRVPFFSILALIMLLLMASQFLIYVQPQQRRIASLNIENYQFFNQTNGTRIAINYTVKSGIYPMDINVAIMQMLNEVRDKQIYIYYDVDYPSSGVGKQNWLGLVDHIPIELNLRGYGGSIQIVNAEELRSIMQTAYDSVVIIPSGVFPNTVHAKNSSLVGNWLQNGGALVWIGDAFAVYSGERGEELQWPSEENPGWIAQEQLLGFSIIDSSARPPESRRMALKDTQFSEALNLQTSDLLNGASVSSVYEHGGVPLGKAGGIEGKERTSIAYVPVGKGHLVVFGGVVSTVLGVNGEAVVANDIAQILDSGFLFCTKEIEYNAHSLKANGVLEASLDINHNSGEKVMGALVFAFSKDLSSRFFTRRVLSTL